MRPGRFRRWERPLDVLDLSSGEARRREKLPVVERGVRLHQRRIFNQPNSKGERKAYTKAWFLGTIICCLLLYNIDPVPIRLRVPLTELLLMRCSMCSPMSTSPLTISLGILDTPKVMLNRIIRAIQYHGEAYSPSVSPGTCDATMVTR